jgi:transaldolase
VDVPDVFEVLEREGVEKFIASWNELKDTVREQLEAAK